KDKEIQNMRNGLQVGDEVTTVGGIVGIVVNIKEDTVVIETGSDRCKIRIKRWAIQTNDTVHEDVTTAV
ncbi:MAG: preprotein translocase subunit YajC, partial [Oscillospiraceae bacterium]